MKPTCMRLVPLQDTPKSFLTSSTKQGYNRKIVIYEAESEPLLSTEAARVFILDFPTSY